MSQPPFATDCPIRSAWGFGWSPPTNPLIPGGDSTRSNGHMCDSRTQTNAGNPNEMNEEQLANMPEALLNTLKRDKKPFTYTPGDVNLSEVLEDKLRKRIERKKKLSMERAAQYMRSQENDASQENFPVFENPKQLLVMPTYNTPLNMYSVENALEALEVQAEMAVKDKSSPLPKINHSQTLPRNHTFRFAHDYDEPKNVTQSRAFRVLQVITDTEEEPPAPTNKYNKYFPEETRFSGIRDAKSIPSKFFQTLQRITGTDEDEEEDQDNPSLVAETKVMNAPGNFSPRQVEARNRKNPPAQQVQPRQEERVTHRPQTNPPAQQYDKKSFAVADQSRVVYEQKNGPLLKRPAAFLPVNMSTPRYVGNQSPAGFQRGPINPRGGTDL